MSRHDEIREAVKKAKAELAKRANTDEPGCYTEHRPREGVIILVCGGDHSDPEDESYFIDYKLWIPGEFSEFQGVYGEMKGKGKTLDEAMTHILGLIVDA